MLPGLTGWAQINGRDNNDDHEKTRHDTYYLNNKSLRFDAKIIFRTVFKVLRAEGILEGTNILDDEEQLNDSVQQNSKSKDVSA